MWLLVFALVLCAWQVAELEPHGFVSPVGCEYPNCDVRCICSYMHVLVCSWVCDSDLKTVTSVNITLK